MLEWAPMPEEGARMPVLRNLWARGRAVPWAVVWEVSRSLWANARDRVNETLSSRERQDFGRLVRKGRGRPWTLTGRERRRLVMLMKKAATGESDSSWDAVGRSLLTLLPPRILTSIWERQDSRP
jgi:hypothetical protein